MCREQLFGDDAPACNPLLYLFIFLFGCLIGWLVGWFSDHFRLTKRSRSKGHSICFSSLTVTVFQRTGTNNSILITSMESHAARSRLMSINRLPRSAGTGALLEGVH